MKKRLIVYKELTPPTNTTQQMKQLDDIFTLTTTNQLISGKSNEKGWGDVADLEVHPIALHDGKGGVDRIHTGCRWYLVEGMVRVRVGQTTARCC